MKVTRFLFIANLYGKHYDVITEDPETRRRLVRYGVRTNSPADSGAPPLNHYLLLSSWRHRVRAFHWIHVLRFLLVKEALWIWCKFIKSLQTQTSYTISRSLCVSLQHGNGPQDISLWTIEASTIPLESLRIHHSTSIQGATEPHSDPTRSHCPKTVPLLSKGKPERES